MGISSEASVTSTSTSSSGGSASVNGSNKAPKPMPMAIMRNAHEVIRGAMSDIQALLDKDDFDGAQTLWHKFHRFSDLHMKMEEGSKKKDAASGLFALVDKHADNVAMDSELRDHHSNLYELEEDVVDIFQGAPDIAYAKKIYPIFRKENESHLTEEEGILMPAIQKMMKRGINIRKYIISDILPVLLEQDDDLEFFIKFANEILEKHDVVEGKPRVRVFDHALWSLASSDEQWSVWNTWIKDSLSEDKYEEVQNAIVAYDEERKAKKVAKELEKQKQQEKAQTEEAEVLTKVIEVTTNPPGEQQKQGGGGFFKKLFATTKV